MSKSREKEIRQLMYLKSEIIKEQKKELKQLRNELERLESEKSKQKTKRR